MRAAIIQSSFIPWQGYFDIIDSVDRFVIFDDVQFTTRDWRTRNRIKGPNGIQWLTVPVKKAERTTEIRNILIDYSESWQNRMKKTLIHCYRKSPNFESYHEGLFSAIDVRYENLSELNVALIQHVCEILDITTQFSMSWEHSTEGRKSERLVNILNSIGADEYISGPSARSYIEPDVFKDNGIKLYYKSYDYAPYPQLWGEYVGGLSIIDLLFNLGENSRSYLHSLQDDEAV